MLSPPFYVFQASIVPVGPRKATKKSAQIAGALSPIFTAG
jgi:hypothetical protein